VNKEYGEAVGVLLCVGVGIGSVWFGKVIFSRLT
jgi:hypothetical protein